MNKEHADNLTRIVKKHARNEGLNTSAISGLSFYKMTTPDTAIPSVYDPSLCIIVQGSKDVLLGKDLYQYGAFEYLAASVDLPVIGRITKASPAQPYLVIKIDFDIGQLSELMLHMEGFERKNNGTNHGLFIGRVDNILCESVLRLIRLLETPADIPILASQTLREIYYRLLQSEYGCTLAQIALKGSKMQKIAAAIDKLKKDYNIPVTIEELAAMTGMSVSSFHVHFKTITAMSPLQYQKSLRLMAARNHMIAHHTDAGSTAYHVGYESPSQFSREYARMFGNPPGKDLRNLKKQGVIS